MGRAAGQTRAVLSGWAALLAAGALMAGALAGCGAQLKGAGAVRSADAARGLGVSGACAFEPVLLSVHPLTRLTRSPDGTGRADVHFELFDRFGHPVKGLGNVLVEALTRPMAAVGGAGGEQLGLWGADLSVPRTNADAYDPVTRTYRLMVSEIPTAVWLDETVEVLVRFMPTDNDARTLHASLVIEVPR